MSTGIDHIFDEAQGVTFFFLGLLEKMLGQLRQRLGRKMGRDRVILQLRAELVTDLLVNGVDDFLARKHAETYRGLRGCKRMKSWRWESKMPTEINPVGI